MKQHIDVKQLQELNEVQKKKLQNWWVPNKGDFYGELEFNYSCPQDGYLECGSDFCPRCGRKVIEKSFYQLNFIHYDPANVLCKFSTNDLPLLSVGQMIEFLAEHQGDSLDIYIWNDTEEPVCNSMGGVCDALWKMVKEILNKK